MKINPAATGVYFLLCRTERQCRKVYNNVCTEVEREECRPVLKEVCQTITDSVPTEQCQDVPREECKEVRLLAITISPSLYLQS